VGSRCFVLDEWIFHDLWGDHGIVAQELAGRFIGYVNEKCDHIAFMKGTRWAEKAMKLMTFSDPLVRSLSKGFHLLILWNQSKCIVLEQSPAGTLPLPVASAVPCDDHYLVETYIRSGAEAIVTHDRRLLDALRNLPVGSGGITAWEKEEFLKEYIRAA
jgi:hypothetical protein